MIFIALNALFGGYFLISDPSGESMEIPFQLLDKTPFNNFLIPGIILFTVIGLMSLIIAYITLKRGTLYPLLILIQGIILGIWLTAELSFDRAFYMPSYHIPLYMISGILIFCGWRMGNPPSNPVNQDKLE